MKIDFNLFADQWLEARCFSTPSALQGWLTGFLASGARLNPTQWQQEAIQYLELDSTPSETFSGLLQQLYPAVLSSLAGDALDFQLLLPADEDADIDEQVECLAQWSKGFLDGFGAAGNIQGELPDDVHEVLQDLDAFSQAQLEDHDPSNELIYLELVEHARVAALTVFYALNQATPNDHTVH